MNTLKRSIRLNKSFYWRIHYSMQAIYSRDFKLSHSQGNNDKVNTMNEEVSKERPFDKDKYTWVGPPHPVSNLRLKVFPTSKHLTQEEVQFYEKSKEIQEWNQHYWESHNRDFERSRKSYMEKVTKEKNLDSKNSLTPEDMAAFYKEFLDKNYKKHVLYNWKWYKRNFELLYLSAVAQLSKLRKLVK